MILYLFYSVKKKNSRLFKYMQPLILECKLILKEQKRSWFKGIEIVKQRFVGLQKFMN